MPSRYGWRFQCHQCRKMTRFIQCYSHSHGVSDGCLQELSYICLFCVALIKILAYFWDKNKKKQAKRSADRTFRAAKRNFYFGSNTVWTVPYMCPPEFVLYQDRRCRMFVLSPQSSRVKGHVLRIERQVAAHCIFQPPPTTFRLKSVLW
jgi:hypothetical protein